MNKGSALNKVLKDCVLPIVHIESDRLYSLLLEDMCNQFCFPKIKTNVLIMCGYLVSADLCNCCFRPVTAK